MVKDKVQTIEAHPGTMEIDLCWAKNNGPWAFKYLNFIERDDVRSSTCFKTRKQCDRSIAHWCTKEEETAGCPATPLDRQVFSYADLSVTQSIPNSEQAPRTRSRFTLPLITAAFASGQTLRY